MAQRSPTLGTKAELKNMKIDRVEGDGFQLTIDHPDGEILLTMRNGNILMGTLAQIAPEEDTGVEGYDFHGNEEGGLEIHDTTLDLNEGGN